MVSLTRMDRSTGQQFWLGTDIWSTICFNTRPATLTSGCPTLRNPMNLYLTTVILRRWMQESAPSTARKFSTVTEDFNPSPKLTALPSLNLAALPGRRQCILRLATKNFAMRNRAAVTKPSHLCGSQLRACFPAAMRLPVHRHQLALSCLLVRTSNACRSRFACWVCTLSSREPSRAPRANAAGYVMPPDGSVELCALIHFRLTLLAMTSNIYLDADCKVRNCGLTQVGGNQVFAHIRCRAVFSSTVRQDLSCHKCDTCGQRTSWPSVGWGKL